MYIIECLPLVKTSGTESLSYFSSKPIEPGSLVKVEIKKKNVSAIVLAIRSATESKAEIRKADFAIKKVGELRARPFLRPEFLEGVRIVAEYFATTSGAVLHHLLPAIILQNPKMLFVPKAKETRGAKEPEKLRYEVEAIQEDDGNRLAMYKAIVRESFAKQKSVFLCLSQNESIRQYQAKLSRGIENFVCAFHDSLSVEELKEEWRKASDSGHPVLIIATASWLFIPRADLGTIILEGENQSGWKTFSRPFLDLHLCVEIIAKNQKAKVILGDIFLRTETLWRYREQQIGGEGVRWRINTPVAHTIINPQQIAQKDAKQSWKPLSNEFISSLKESVEEGGNIFVYASRKGLASTTVCQDCGAQVGCHNCSAPMILYKTKNGNVFRCHQCSEIRSAEEFCHHCQSWRLVALGLGVDKVLEEIRKAFPELESQHKIFELHKDVAPTSAKAQKIMEQFQEARGAILVGTELALAYLHKKVHTTAIAAIDSLFSIPDFRIREKIFRLILEIKSLAKENFVIQSRNSNDKVVDLALSGNLADFYKLEIADREVLQYPPFSVFVKVTVRGTKNFVTKETENLRQILAPWQPIIFASIHEKKGTQAAVNAILKIPHDKYPDPQLSLVLKSLPPHFELKISPDNLL